MTEEVFVQGVSLERLANWPGPFATLYLPVDPQQPPGHPAGIDDAVLDGVPAALQARLRSIVGRHAAPADVVAVAYVVTADEETAFDFVDPIVKPICRHGRYPALGPVVEQHQLVSSHAVITVDDDRYGVTSFGSVAVPDAIGRSWGVHSSLETIVEELRFATPRLLVIASTDRDTDAVVEHLQVAFPLARTVCYQSEDLDEDLDSLADRVVRDAATLAAEEVAHELGAFRAATAEGLAVEGPDVIDALDRSDVVAVLVHDDIDDDRRRDGDRLVDITLAKALARGIRVTMIPGVDERRGPEGGLGAIIGGARVGATAAVDDEQLVLDRTGTR